MHTPGPWIDDGAIINALVDPLNSDSYIAPICYLDKDWREDITSANARLIAAAPALLTALAELVGALEADAMDDKSNVYRSMMLSANHAIALATED